MKTQLPARTILKFLVVLSIFFWLVKPAQATDYQNCSTNQSCAIGEFLYDDNSNPDATASCKLTTRNPNGTLLLNSVTMVASSSGWYQYSASISSTTGIYPSEICCDTVAGQHLCLDKTFQVTTPTVSGATASEVWNYSDRSLTSFGSLVSDIWNYSSKSLSNFGDLVSNIWSHSDRSLTSTSTTSTSTLASAAQILEIRNIVKENRLLLEQLINKPIVKTFIDDAPVPNLSEKLQKTQTAAANLYGGVQNLKSRSLLIQEKWPTLTESEMKSELTTLSSIFTQDINQKDTSIIASTNWLKTSWNSPILLNLSDQAQAAQSQIANLLNDLNLYGTTAFRPNAFDPALSHIEKLDSLVGTSLATASDLNLYGFVKKTTSQIALFDAQSAEGLRILTEIRKDSTQDQSSAISNLSTDVLKTNLVPEVSAFSPTSAKTNTPVNKVLGLMALVDSNRILLASDIGQALKNIWLEEGSIIFRSVAINPSYTLTQKVTVKYYLPTELKKEQVISHDPMLTIDYDPVENALFASGEITLAPQETQTFLVEVEDIWSFHQEEIDSLKNQVNELIAALKGTSSFAQATTIKSDIIVSLDKIMLRQQQAITPENRIQTYRESALEMNGIEDKITSLKELVIQSQTRGGFLGFVGGIQTVSLWGIVLVIIAGFVFLSLYLNALRSEARLKKAEGKKLVTTALEEHDSIYHPSPKYHHRENTTHRGHKIARIASIALLAGGLSSLGVSLIIKTKEDPTIALKQAPNSTVVLGTTADKKYPYEIKLKVPDSGVIPVRSSPSITSPEIMRLNDVESVFVFKVTNGWAQIGLSDKDQDKLWWVSEQYLSLN